MSAVTSSVESIAHDELQHAAQLIMMMPRRQVEAKPKPSHSQRTQDFLDHSHRVAEDHKAERKRREGEEVSLKWKYPMKPSMLSELKRINALCLETGANSLRTKEIMKSEQERVKSCRLALALPAIQEEANGLPPRPDVEVLFSN